MYGNRNVKLVSFRFVGTIARIWNSIFSLSKPVATNFDDCF